MQENFPYDPVFFNFIIMEVIIISKLAQKVWTKGAIIGAEVQQCRKLRTFDYFEFCLQINGNLLEHSFVLEQN